jgi:hypothetical protein
LELSVRLLRRRVSLTSASLGVERGVGHARSWPLSASCRTR